MSTGYRAKVEVHFGEAGGEYPWAGPDEFCASRVMALHPFTVLVMAKAPVPGQVKTRLCPPMTPPEAARLAAAALLDTMDSVDSLQTATSSSVSKVIALEGSLVHAVDGAQIAGRITAAGNGRWTRIPQRGASFADRLIRAHRDAAGRGPVLQIGMDTPQLTGAILAESGQALFRRDVDAIVGPASDGGWWSLGVRNAQAARALVDVPMSTADTCELTIRALRADGLRVALLPMLTDVDTVNDANEVVAAAPNTRFAGTFRAITMGKAA